MDDAALYAELTNDPEGLGYAALIAIGSDQGIADVLNRADRAGKREVPAGDVIRTLTLCGRWPGIVLASRRAPTDTAADAVILAAINMVEATMHFPTFDLQDSTYLGAITAGLDALVSAGLIDANDKAIVLALDAATVSRGQQLGLGIVSHMDVARTLRGNS